MKTIKGNLLDLFDQGEFDVIVHGCNCFHTMGAGIAGQIALRYPVAVRADINTKYGSAKKLGDFSIAVHVSKRIIINAYTQFNAGREYPEVLYGSIKKSFNLISKSGFDRCRIGIPKIGCGIAGGDWIIVEKIIEEEMKGFDITCVEFCE